MDKALLRARIEEVLEGRVDPDELDELTDELTTEVTKLDLQEIFDVIEEDPDNELDEG